jgi:phosphoribosyl-ATP pyrophosphohydrolase/phosphoribosyl-AMP cyclohydrolase
MTDRTLRTPADLDVLAFAKGEGLVPVVAQDAHTGTVLMVAWADREAMERTLSSGRLWLFSRSRDTLWQKGETSGNVLDVLSLHADCDGDTVLARVRPSGPACHTGELTCFGEGAASTEGLAALDATLASRAAQRPEGSYTVKLLDDANLRLKKLGEETAELVAALATEDAPRVAEESADLLYHLLVAMRGAGVELASVMAALEARRG